MHFQYFLPEFALDFETNNFIENIMSTFESDSPIWKHARVWPCFHSHEERMLTWRLKRWKHKEREKKALWVPMAERWEKELKGEKKGKKDEQREIDGHL